MIAFIIQARLASTRLPNKILLPFWKDENILSILLKKLSFFKGVKVIVATSDNPINDPLIDFLEKEGVDYYRGNEDDVLDRFISAARQYGVDRIIRICSDNPFLDMQAIKILLDYSSKSEADYISFLVNKLPSIKTHFGFWTEYITLNSLMKVQKLTSDALYHEHVTNYIYAHPEQFKIEWIDGPVCLMNRDDIRLTTDTLIDFQNAQQIYNDLYKEDGPYPGIEAVVPYLDSHSEYLEIMKSEIMKNNK